MCSEEAECFRARPDAFELVPLAGGMPRSAARGAVDSATRGGGGAVERRQPAMEQVFAAKLDELVERSHGRMRPDVAHGKLLALGYRGSARSTAEYAPMTAKEMLKVLVRRTGYDLMRTSKQDPWHAVSILLADRAHPVILDVGANAGQTASHCSRLLPTARVYSFEPSPTAYRALRAAVGGLQRVETFNVAMGEQAGTITLLENTVTELTSVLRPDAAAWGEIVRETPVEVWTVDQFRDEHNIDRIDVLKTDTQGFDLSVLRGAGNALAASAVDVILTEVTFVPMYQEAPRFDKLLGYALDHGFQVTGVYPFIRPHGLVDFADVLLVHERLEQITRRTSR